MSQICHSIYNNIKNKKIYLSLISLLLAAHPTINYADEFTTETKNYAQTTDNDLSTINSDLSKLTGYFLNLGSYMGLNLSVASSTSLPSTPPSSTLLSPNNEKSFEIYVLNTLLGAFPITSTSPFNTFVPSSGLPNNMQSYSNINSFANLTYNTQNYNSSSSSTVSVIPNIDQPSYQLDATSQTIQNLITSPDITFCPNTQTNMNGNTYTTFGNISSTNQACNMMIPINVIGQGNQLQNPFAPCSVEPYLSQLNVNSLLGPLLYNTSSNSNNSTNASSNSGSNSGCNSSNTIGLPNETQAQVAEAFVRYATNSITPPSMPQASEFATALSNAQNNGDPTLANFLVLMRERAAQISVPVSNLYFMMQRRLPQNNSNNLSQALAEFQQATWRLMNPNAQGSSGSNSDSTAQQWTDLINNASPATVQKESALLLAEINYQLYLMRQFQERQLLTESILAIAMLNMGGQSSPSLTTAQSVQASTPNVTYSTSGQ